MNILRHKPDENHLFSRQRNSKEVLLSVHVIDLSAFVGLYLMIKNAFLEKKKIFTFHGSYEVHLILVNSNEIF